MPLCLGVELPTLTLGVHFVTGAHLDILSSRWPKQNNEPLLHSRSVSPFCPSTPGKDCVFVDMLSSVEPTEADVASKQTVITVECRPTKKRKRVSKETACASTQTEPCDLAVRNRVLLQSLEKLKGKVNRRMRRMIGLIQSSTQPE
jgi:hypothetical protein